MSGGIGRASTLLASGTTVSRLLGFVSLAVLAQTLGSRSIGANTFALANQLPNNIYAIIAGGLLSSVFVPAIVRAALHADGGQAFVNRLVTLGTLVFLAAGILATVAAPLLIRLYASQGDATRGLSADDLALATAFAYWCLPQVFFYAMYSLLGEVLNARGIFGPFTWAPAINNVVAIIGLLVFAASFGSGPANSADWTPDAIALIAARATIGVAAQAIVLMFFWRRAGLTFRPDFHFRGVGLGAAGKAAAWTFGMILVTQLAGIVQSRVTSQADGAGYAILQYSWLIFMLPHSIAVVSIATAYFTRMSTHVRDGKLDLLRSDLAQSLKTSGLIIVFASVGLIVLAFPFSAVFSTTWAGVAAMAPVLAVFLIGLVPFSVLYVLRRTFYALGDTRTPFFITLFQAILFVILALLVLVFPPTLIGLGIAAVTTFAGIAQTTLAIVLLRRKLVRLGGRGVLRRYVQFAVASLPSALVGIGAVALLGGLQDGGFGSSGPVGGLVTMAIAGVAMVAVYAGVLRLMRNPELGDFVAPIMRRLRPSR